GVLRLGMGDRITQYLPPEVCLPEAGQGALAAQVRADDAGTSRLAAVIDDAPTRQAVTAERAAVTALGGGCTVPIAALAIIRGAELELHGLVASADGKRLVRAKVMGKADAAEQAGKDLALKLLAMGANEILNGT
ncbi:MAG: hydroxymethylbilane synthase, partial [Dehalococcoidia bacterium]|nr:hydroxymethylbilane synthase [Dehalococcoidia bacterium]